MLSEPEYCPECQFDWSVAGDDAIDFVAGSPHRCDQTLKKVDPHTSIRPGLWSPCQYLWHLVDVLRFGTERLWTLAIDPAAGVPGWDENDMARARRYEKLSAVVGLRACAAAADHWVEAARSAPGGARTAHEMHHHLMDIGSGHPKTAL